MKTMKENDYFKNHYEKIDSMCNMNKLLRMNSKLLSRFKLLIDTETIEYSIEDSVTGKIYQSDSYEKMFSDIKADLRKEKIKKIISE